MQCSLGAFQRPILFAKCAGFKRVMLELMRELTSMHEHETTKRTCRGHAEAMFSMTVTWPANLDNDTGFSYCSTVKS